MKALTVQPLVRDSARLDDVDEPPASAGEILVGTHAVGVCGTDREILNGDYGTAPDGEQRLILGHESIGRVIEAPADSGLTAGDWVVGIVRHPDPKPCASCAVGEWDMCRNGEYTEHGIKSLHGFAAERYRIGRDHAVKVDPALGELAVLVEPTSVVAKAWEHIERIAARATVPPQRILVTGGGPIGLLAAMLGVQRGLDVRVFDRHRAGAKPALVEDLGARHVSEGLEDECRAADVIIECTGAAEVIYPAIAHAPPNAIVCLTGVSAKGSVMRVDVGALNRDLVLENNVVFGTVNANRRHYEAAARALGAANRGWLERLITRRVPLAEWARGLERDADGVKSILLCDAA